MTGVGLDDLRFETGGGTYARSRPGKLDWGAERAIQAVKEGVRLQTEFETQLFASGDPSRSHMLVREREREGENVCQIGFDMHPNTGYVWNGSCVGLDFFR